MIVTSILMIDFDGFNVMYKKILVSRKCTLKYSKVMATYFQMVQSEGRGGGCSFYFT